MEGRNADQYELIMKFMFHLAVCHTVIIQETSDEKGVNLSYSASSPDELALVNAARYFGFMFKDRDSDNRVTVDFTNVINQY
jgi:magnesium-transporting ATPase (P-type)